VPLVTVIAAALFTTANGYLQMNHIAHKHCSAPTNYTLFHIGLAVFLAGAFINIKSDAILRNLRPERSAEYKIPRGFLFEYVSCANLFGEIVEWFGFALSSGSLPGWTFMVCTLCNLLPRALSSHRWYKTRFGGSYPEHRRALVPFVL
jgi:steroid 5-alpha reductase family enzyme